VNLADYDFKELSLPSSDDTEIQEKAAGAEHFLPCYSLL
jgi:hypothetical protein